MRQPAVNIGVRAVRSASNVLLRMLKRLDAISITEKDRNDFVTEADVAAEQAILREIRKAYPDHAVLAEESGASGNSDYVWIIDPLDGTRNFIYGFPHFSISLAMQHKGVTEHAIVYDPLREELFTASRGGGAFLNDHRIRVGDRKTLDGSMLATGFPFRARRHLDAYMAMFSALFEQATDIRRAGSAALDLAYVAAGRVDGFWEIGLHSWDMAAGALLIQEAGGTCSDFNGGSDFLETGNIIAGNLKLAAAMQREIAPHRQDGIRR